MVRRLSELLDWEDEESLWHDGQWLPGHFLTELGRKTVHLADEVACPDEAVAFLVRNRPAHLAALFGLLAAHRPIRFVNAFQAPEKIAQDLDMLGARLTLADEEDCKKEPLAARAAGRGAAILLGPRDVRIERSREVGEPGPILPDLAVEMMTSGTTGVPKRIPYAPSTIEDALADQVRIAAEMGDAPPSLAPEASVIQYAPILHIAGLWTVLQMGLERRRVVLLEKFDAASWVDAVRTLRPKLVGFSPPLLRMVVALDPPPEALSSLVAIRCGSGALDRDTREAFQSRYLIPLLSVYGATEYAGTVASWSLADHRLFAAAKPDAAGRIRRHVADVRVVDAADGHPLPAGETGLVEVRVPRVGGDWMRSSDLGSIDGDDFLTLHGRADGAIVRGGFKILPDQLVAVLRRHPAVADAAVVPLDHPLLGQVPAAAIELREGASADVAEIDRHMRAALPAYHVPAHYRIAARLPRTPAAKIILAKVAALFASE